MGVPAPIREEQAVQVAQLVFGLAACVQPSRATSTGQPTDNATSIAQSVDSEPEPESENPLVTSEPCSASEDPWVTSDPWLVSQQSASTSQATSTAQSSDLKRTKKSVSLKSAPLSKATSTARSK